MEERVTIICQDLIRIKSVNPPGNEAKVAEYIAQLMAEIGLTVELVDHGDQRVSVLGFLGNAQELSIPHLVFSGHLDTVPVGSQKWTQDPFTALVSDGKIWGRGAADMKGGVAAMIVAAETLIQTKTQLNGVLVLAFSADEEVDSLGAHVLAQQLAPRNVQALLIAEPSGNEVYIAEKGALWLELTTYGKTAHGAAPEEGENAIMMMVALLDALSNLDIHSEDHPLLGKFTRSINTIDGGVKANVVPDRCTVTVDMRTVPGQNHQGILQEVQGVIDALSRRYVGFQATHFVINNREPVVTSPSEPIVATVLDSIDEVAGERLVPRGVSYYTDATAYVPVLNAPMVICGPGEARLAHQTDEYIEIHKLVEATKIYTRVADRFLA